jgi:hypothetical protein
LCAGVHPQSVELGVDFLQIPAGGGLAGVERQRPAEVLSGAFQHSQLLERETQIAVGFGIVRVDPDGLFKLVDRAVQVALAPECRSQVVASRFKSGASATAFCKCPMASG